MSGCRGRTPRRAGPKPRAADAENVLLSPRCPRRLRGDVCSVGHFLSQAGAPRTAPSPGPSHLGAERRGHLVWGSGSSRQVGCGPHRLTSWGSWPRGLQGCELPWLLVPTWATTKAHGAPCGGHVVSQTVAPFHTREGLRSGFASSAGVTIDSEVGSGACLSSAVPQGPAPCVLFWVAWPPPTG